MPKKFDPVPLADLAAGQWGLITTSQAQELSISPQQIARLAKRGALDRIRHGVYRVAGAPPHPDQEVRAAWLAIDPDRTAYERLEKAQQPGVLSHRSAAVIRGLGNLDADVHEFTVTEPRRSRLSDLKFHHRELNRSQWTQFDGLPITTTLVTIEDLAKQNLDGGHLAGVVRDALTTEHLDLEEVAQALRPFAHYYGAPLGDGKALVELFLDQAGVPASTVAVAALSDPRRQARLVENVSNNLAHSLAIAMPDLTTSFQALSAPAFKAMAAQIAQQAQLAVTPQMIADLQALTTPLSAAVEQLARRFQENARTSDVASLGIEQKSLGKRSAAQLPAAGSPIDDLVESESVAADTNLPDN